MNVREIEMLVILEEGCCGWFGDVRSRRDAVDGVGLCEGKMAGDAGELSAGGKYKEKGEEEEEKVRDKNENEKRERRDGK